MSRIVELAIFVFFVSLVVNPVCADPLSPQDELKTFKTLPGLKVELVASEPDEGGA